MTFITGQPIVFVGTGQTYNDLRSLNVNAVVNSLLKWRYFLEYIQSIHSGLYNIYFQSNRIKWDGIKIFFFGFCSALHINILIFLIANYLI